MKKRIAVFFLLTGIFQLKIKAQGCSDAGICTAGALQLTSFSFQTLPKDVVTISTIDEEDVELKILGIDSVVVSEKAPINPNISSAGASNPSETNEQAKLYPSFFPKHIYGFSTSYGVGDRKTIIITNQFEFFSRISSKLYAQIKIPYAFISGKLGSVNGLGDVTASLSYFAVNKGNSALSFVIGTKVPTNRSNKSLNGNPLPMIYQTSLGSNDVLLGAKYTYKGWEVSAGYQHVVTENRNNYLHVINQGIEYNKYFESKDLKRTDDAILRVAKTIKIKTSYFGVGLLSIHHLAEDKITNALGKRESVKNSSGMTLNLNVSGNVAVTKQIDLQFILANRIQTREARPDGLGRSAVAIVGINYKVYRK